MRGHATSEGFKHPEGGCIGDRQKQGAWVVLPTPSVLIDSCTLLPALLRSSDMAGFMPRSAAETAIRAGRLSSISCDLPVVASAVDMVWHVRSDGDIACNGC